MACIQSKGLPDNCKELKLLRIFRDQYVCNLKDGDAIIDNYYHISPIIVKKIKEQQNSKEIFKSLFAHIQEAVVLIEQKKLEEAFQHYSNMVTRLKCIYIDNCKSV